MASSVMDGSGFYNEHSAQQQHAAAAGVAMLEQAAAEVPLPGDEPLVVADYGASEGGNSLHPLGVALDRIRVRSGAGARAICVVHTDLPANDFSSLFETVARDVHTYAERGSSRSPPVVRSTSRSSRPARCRWAGRPPRSSG
jgi:hypothetical protein